MSEAPTNSPPPAEPGLAPPSLWYTVEDGQQAGPWSLPTLHERQRTGVIGPMTLVWSDTMSEWTPYARQFATETPQRPVDAERANPPAFVGGSRSSAILPPAQRQAAPNGQASTATMASMHDITPAPWQRWLARLVDIYLTVIVAGFVLGLAGLGALLTSRIAWALFAPACLALLEPFFLHRFGATPGKGLLNIQVTEPTGVRLTLPRAFARSWRTWSIGSGFGLPIVSLITLSNQHSHLKKDGMATYDASLGISVSHGPVGSLRVLGIVAFGIIFFALLVLGAT